MKLPKELEAKVLALSGAAAVPMKPKPKRNRAPVVRVEHGDSPWAIVLRPECRVVSEANQRVHWAVRAKRFTQQSQALALCLFDAGLWRSLVAPYVAVWLPPLPCVVAFTHIGPRMDDDNLAGAFKGLRDAIAERWFGIDDGDERVRWDYAQRAGSPGVEIRIEAKV